MFHICILSIDRYKLHLVSATTQYPNTNTGAHSQKKKKLRNLKSRYSIPALTNNASATETTPELQTLKNNVSKKKTVRETPSSDHRFLLQSSKQGFKQVKGPPLPTTSEKQI
jgi:hypothetical protein